MSKTKIYIAGKIGGLSESIFIPKFEQAKRKLIDLGYDAIIPTEFEHDHGHTWAEYMLEDLMFLSRCDAICLLPCWEDSPGARIEHQFAVGARKEVYHFNDLVQP